MTLHGSKVKSLEEIRNNSLMKKDYHLESDLYTIVETIKRVGPRNVSLISRLTGIPVETVRYKIRRQLIKNGIGGHISVNYSKLGLVRQWLALNFDGKFRDFAPKMFATLSKTGYLIYYGRILPEGTYISIIALPPRLQAQYVEFLDRLMDLGILASYEMDELAWIRHLSMRPEYYDFETKAWKVNWDSLHQSKVIVKKMLDTEVGEPLVDKSDLLILKELQIDSMKPISQIAKGLGLKPKTVRYHYMEHILRRGLITNFIVRWQGSKEDIQRLTLNAFIEFRNLTERSLLDLQKAFHRLPFTWFDAVSNNQSLYLAFLSLPVTQYISLLNYLRVSVSAYKFGIKLVDMSCAQAYTIPYEMFNETQGWVFNPEKTLKALTDVVPIIKA